jgi:glycosyltransferase involved in cell wall biosynthesis
LEENKTILFIPPVLWNYYPYRDQELPAMFASKGFSCIYLNPLKYKGSEKVGRFQSVNKRDVPEHLTIVDRSSALRKSLLLFIYENYINYTTVKKLKPDAVISTDHLMAFFTCIYCKIKGVKFAFDVTDNWELVDKSLAGKLYKWFIKPAMIRFAYAVTCTSKTQFDFFNKRRKKNTYLISNGIATAVFDAIKNEPSKPEISRSFNFIGSLRDWYDFDLLFDVFKHLPEIELNIYGQGELFETLKVKSQDIPNIKLHGNIDSKATPALLKTSLFGILPLKQNELNRSTCPIKLFDYWGASKAVISTPVDEIKRVAGEAVLFASSVDEFIKQIQLLLNEPKLASELGNQGYEKVEKIHNYQYISQQFIELLKL